PSNIFNLNFEGFVVNNLSSIGRVVMSIILILFEVIPVIKVMIDQLDAVESSVVMGSSPLPALTVASIIDFIFNYGKGSACSTCNEVESFQIVLLEKA
ncbi:hypothetical protein C5167_002515, partial [Papaver somniferum]